VLGATVRSVGKGGEKSEPLEDFLANSEGRLLLDVSYDEADRQTGYASVWRPHTHHYTILAVSAARRDGELRVAATGVAPRAVLIEPDDPVGGLDLRDDPLASSWYRARLLPTLVQRALANLEEA
jgi:CO/xanthine dehydrogenase FAD-binding subunit